MIQYAPQLLPAIKLAVDRDREPGRFWLTGSQQFHLMRQVSESLAGRVGAMLETWILTELLKSWWHRGLRAPFYFYRDRDQKEIDLLIVRDNVLYPIEFKKSASPKHRSR